MRTDVKLGVILSVVVVGGALLYFTSKPANDEPIPVGDSKVKFTDASESPNKTTPGKATTPNKASKSSERDELANRGNRPRGNNTSPTARRSPAQQNDRSFQADRSNPDRGNEVAPVQPQRRPNEDQPRVAGNDKPRMDSARPGVDVTQPRLAGNDPAMENPTTGENRVATNDDANSSGNVASLPENASGNPSGSPTQPSPGVSGADTSRVAATPPVFEPTRPVGDPSRTIEPSNAAVEKHIVQEGDSFASIARMYYGSETLTQFLVDANNHIPDPNLLRIGVYVKIPPRPADVSGATTLAAVSRPKSESTTGARTDETLYVVQPGDSFYRIALNELGDSSRWEEIFELNKELVGGDPKRLKMGAKIKLPARETKTP